MNKLFLNTLVLLPNIWDFCTTGASKQYGFVEFSKTLDEIKEICHQLNGKALSSGEAIACDLMTTTVVDFEQLRASCLCVKNLPVDFTDDQLLQKEFSIIAKPLFCRVSWREFFKCRLDGCSSSIMV